MIYTNYDGLDSLMLHIVLLKRSTGSRFFFKVFAIYSPGRHPGHVTRTIYTSFGSPSPKMLHRKFSFDWPGCLEMFEYCGQQQAPEHGYTVTKLTLSELKMGIFLPIFGWST